MPVDLQRPRQEDVLRRERTEPFRDGGLAVARSSVQEDRASRVHGGPQRVHHAIGQHQVVEGPHELLTRHPDVPHRLAIHPLSEVVERDGGRSDVPARLQRGAGAAPPLVGEREGIPAPAVPQRLQDLDQVLLLLLEEKIVEDREGERHDVGQVVPPQGAPLVEDLEQEVSDEGLGETGRLDRLRDGRSRGLRRFRSVPRLRRRRRGVGEVWMDLGLGLH